MAITEPISERIVQRLETVCKGISIANGYPMNAEVYRTDTTGRPVNPDNKDFAITIVVISDDEQKQAGACGKDCFKMMVGFWCNIRTTDKDTVPIGTRQARARASLKKALSADPNANGLAAVTTVVTSDDKMEQRMPAADVVLEVVYFTARGNPFSLS